MNIINEIRPTQMAITIISHCVPCERRCIAGTVVSKHQKLEKYTRKWYLEEKLTTMAKNTSIILGDHFEEFVQSEIRTGRYSSASEVIRSALRLLEIEKQKIEAINKALTEGENSGEPVTFDNEKFKSRMKKKFNIDA